MYVGPRCGVVRPEVAGGKEPICRLCGETGEQQLDRVVVVRSRSMMFRDIDMDIVGVVVSNVENACTTKPP